LAGILIVDQIQNSSNTLLINSGALAANTVTNTQIAANTVTATNMQTGSLENYMISQCTSFGIRNKIINGAMMISQRNGTSTITPADNDYVTDRWSFGIAQSSKLTSAQSSVAPAGFSNSVLVTSSSAFTPSSTDLFRFTQKIEGFNTVDLAFGTASAKSVTLTFWVQSSLTGTFGGSLQNNAGDRSYPFTYTILSANTWEQKSLTIPGDTTGTWVGATNGIGLYLNFSLGAGSSRIGTAGAWAAAGYYGATGQVNLVSTNAATWYITGVQFEKGSQSTPFEYRPYGKELMLCQRYFNKLNPDGSNNGCGALRGSAGGSTIAAVGANFPQMRAAPSVTLGGTNTWWLSFSGSSQGTGTPSGWNVTKDSIYGEVTSLNNGSIVAGLPTTYNGTVSLSAEL